MHRSPSRWSRRAVIGLFSCLLWTTAVCAVDHPNFTGEWKLNVNRSSFGADSQPDSATYTIQHDGPRLVLDVDLDGKKTHAEVTTDGQERVTDSGPDSEIWTRAYWAGPVLVFESRDKARPAHASRGLRWTSRWNLSDDGKTLAILKHIRTPRGEFDQRLIFEKQD